MKKSQQLLAIAAFSLAIGIAAGAFGAHALKGQVPDADLAIWNTAVLYQMINSIAVFLILQMEPRYLSVRAASNISSLLLLGISIFSGSLFTLVLSDIRWFGAITPIGGLALIMAWVSAGIMILRKQ